MSALNAMTRDTLESAKLQQTWGWTGIGQMPKNRINWLWMHISCSLVTTLKEMQNSRSSKKLQRKTSRVMSWPLSLSNEKTSGCRSLAPLHQMASTPVLTSRIERQRTADRTISSSGFLRSWLYNLTSDLLHCNIITEFPSFGKSLTSWKTANKVETRRQVTLSLL